MNAQQDLVQLVVQQLMGLDKNAINAQLNGSLNHHMAVLASWTCDDVSGGYSTFCDNVWPIWEIDFVNTGILTSIVAIWIGIWALIFGYFQLLKKEAFLKP